MTNQKKIGYELFLRAAAEALYGKESSDSQVTQSEFKDIVAGTFIDAVAQFMKDSLLYTIEVPIDLYANNKRYDLFAPEGYLIEDVVELKENKTVIPSHCKDLKSITLTCCPKKDIEKAFYAVLALSVKRSAAICEFDCDFIERYYDAILANMFKRFAAMGQRDWKSLGSVSRLERDYMNYLNDASRQALNGGEKVKLHTRRMTSNASC